MFMVRKAAVSMMVIFFTAVTPVCEGVTVVTVGRCGDMLVRHMGMGRGVGMMTARVLDQITWSYSLCEKKRTEMYL